MEKGGRGVQDPSAKIQQTWKGFSRPSDTGRSALLAMKRHPTGVVPVVYPCVHVPYIMLCAMCYVLYMTRQGFATEGVQRSLPC
jgi:hypothetical protein